ncbi:M48 family metallopeptidase [Aliamphritea ceti]|uniref:M48 family metallopeptidase n=1 Tax=Aliamphritea ceti TaxID=1524258 RepID=UPI0021C3D2FB|nr:M48 family metallopeptidase [Aliamphritea ceti]
MNFYEAQAQASKRSYWLIFLFACVTFLLIGLTTLFVITWLWFDDGGYYDPQINLLDSFTYERLGWVAGGICAGLLVTALLKWLEVSRGGAAIAESMGASPVLTETDNLLERRLLNVVAEMSIAAGVPVPPVYIMQEERGINAFAAGLKITDAVICVSQGALDHLDRDELQGVVAHEMSHIFNGDMRLNIRLLVVLHGLMCIGEIGRDLLFSRTSGRSKPIGLGLFLIGWIGTLGGSLIKSAVGRQREYLADAAAVKFTRNPAGIAGALKAIGSIKASSRINSRGGHEASHFFFASIEGLAAVWMATHPPLRKRILAIEPGWDGRFSEVRWQQAVSDANTYKQEESSGDDRKEAKLEFVANLVFGGPLFGLVSIDDIEYVRAEELPEELYDSAQDSVACRAIMLSLLLSADKALRNKQYQMIVSCDSVLAELVRVLENKTKGLSRGAYLPWVLLAMPALKQQSAKQYRVYKRLLMQLIHADQRIDLFEWCLYKLLSHYCDGHFGIGSQRKAAVYSVDERMHAFQRVASMLVWHGRDSCSTDEELARNFNLATNTAGFYNSALLSQKQCEEEPLSLFSEAVGILAAAEPLLKARYLKGLVRCAQKDGRISIVERELLTAVAAVMESPLIGLDADL